MFAKFSPDGSRVGYVRENNIYVEDLSKAAGSGINQITKDGGRYIINGTFDWVYEEELFCRDGWRWSPDGKQIAYWQLNSEGVKEFQLVNNTAGLYPVITSFPYPKAGEKNSAARVGVVGSSGGNTRWSMSPAIPATTICRDWNGRRVLPRSSSSNSPSAEHRLVMLGDTRNGKVRTVLTEKEDTWVDGRVGRA